jgi:hypothetical protein
MVIIMKSYFFEETEYNRAKRKVKEIRSFYYNLACYCILIPALIIMNLTFTPEFHWFWFSVAGWGSALLVHGISAFGYMPFLGKDWEQKKIKELMEKDSYNRNLNN